MQEAGRGFKAVMKGSSCGDVFPWEKQSPSHLQPALGCRESLKSIPLPLLSKRSIYGGLKATVKTRLAKIRVFFLPCMFSKLLLNKSYAEAVSGKCKLGNASEGICEEL